MQINVKLSPDVLDWVMAHIQQENVPRDVVKYLTIWKSGEKLPTFNQIEKVSKASGIPFGYFFLQEPPKEEFPLLEYRTIDSTSAMNPSRNIIDVMHDMEQVQDWARNHAIEEEQQAPEFIGSQKNNVDTEDFAEYVRTVLELEIKWYENSKSAVESFKTLRDKISQAGVIVMMSGIVGNNTHRPLDINEFRAFAMVDDLVPLIFINSNDSVNGKLFSLLHEFAHICIGNNSLYNDRYSSGTRVSKAESVSNAVAAEILVPQVMFEKKWKEIDKFDDPIKTIDVLTKYFSCGKNEKRKKSKAVAETIIELRQAELIHGFSRAWSQAFTKEKLYTRTLLDLLIPIDLPLKIWLTKWGVGRSESRSFSNRYKCFADTASYVLSV